MLWAYKGVEWNVGGMQAYLGGVILQLPIQFIQSFHKFTKPLLKKMGNYFQEFGISIEMLTVGASGK